VLRVDQLLTCIVVSRVSVCSLTLPDASVAIHLPWDLNPTIVVMKSAQNGARTNDTGALYRARHRRIFVQGPMRSETVVIVSVGFQDLTQMRLATDDYVIDTLAPDRSDKPFAKAILPGRGWRNRLSLMPIARSRRVTMAP
jgi:hypothetical protein